MGYGGEVTTRSTDSSGNSDITVELEKIILWTDLITIKFLMEIGVNLSWMVS